MKQYARKLIALFLLISSVASAFVPPASRTGAAFAPATVTTAKTTAAFFPPALQRQRKSVAPVQTMGLFGLGAPEIAIILVAAAFLLGPQKLAEFGKDAGKIAGELKEVPKEFQKGLQEGETSAKTMKGADATEAEKEEK